MIEIVASLVLAQLFPPEPDARPVPIEGRCTYSPALVEQAEGTILVPCGQAIVSAQGIAFANRGFEPALAFAGQWDGAELDVSRVDRRGLSSLDDARGSCRIDARQGDVAAIVCSVVAGPRSYLVNFLVPRL